MAEKTKISWTDSTFNPWIGCTKVGPGCDHCYAADLDSRKRWDGGKTHWGAGVPRYRTSASNWAQPLRWNAKQEDLRRQGDAPPWRVFCASLADVFDNEIDPFWRRDLWDLIERTPHLSWLLVTKRVGNVLGIMPSKWVSSGFPDHVRILITVCNQEEADRDIPKLLALPCKNGISYEPALEYVNWNRWLMSADEQAAYPVGFDGEVPRSIEWIIVGGESGPKARPFDLAWARSTVAQCKDAGTAVFCKQLGARPVEWVPGWHIDGGGTMMPLSLQDRAGTDPAEWPEDLRIRQFPTT